MDRPEFWDRLRPAHDLADALRRIDGRGYKAYRDIKGAYDLGMGRRLRVDHVQADPFAPPSRVRLQIDHERAGWPADLYANRAREVAFADGLGRRFAAAASSVPRTDKGSVVQVHAGTTEVLPRSSVCLDERMIELRCGLALPAAGRRILGQRATSLLLELFPEMLDRICLADADSARELRQHVDTVEDQVALRGQLPEHGLIAFVADGAVLPRQSGISQRPLPNSVPFRSPSSLRVRLQAPHAGTIEGMGIREGVTLFCGGGFHGKSTLLDAVARCVYDHPPGDGRELCVTEPSAVKLRAEPGRSVPGVDIRAFLGPLPGGGDPACFISENASGSTSQAAAIVEAIEAESRLLLMDEDSSASNLLFQDQAMRSFLADDDEPIRHLITRVRQLYQERGVSSILVMGGSGEYFGVADCVLQLRSFVTVDATQRAAETARSLNISIASPPPWPTAAPRRVRPGCVDPSRGRRAVSVRVSRVDELKLGQQRVDLRGLEQLVDADQTRCLGHMLAWAADELFGAGEPHPPTLAELMGILQTRLEEEGFSAWVGWPVGDMAQVRRQDLAAALSRLRGVRFESGGGVG